MHPSPKYCKNLKANKVFGLACVLILSAATTQAVDRFWVGGTGTYNSAADWGGTIPNGGDNAIVNNGGTVLINPADPDWTVNDIRAGDGGATTGSWIQDGPTVTLNGWFRLGLGGGTGSYLFKSGTMNDNGRFNVGEGGTATFTMTNTTANNTLAIGSELWCGNGATGNGTVNLGGNARLTVNNWLAIGRDGSTGVLNLSGNASITKTGGGNITFAGLTGATANGTLNQTGGAVTNESSETWLSEDGIGVWNMSSGYASLALLQFGRNGSANGNFNLNGGILAVNQITMGTGSGALNFNGGTLRARASSGNFMSGVIGFLLPGGAILDSQGFNITISSQLSDSNGGSLTKIGSGTATLTGANNYLGATIISAGKLIESTASIVSSAVTVANTAGYGVTVSSANAQVSHANVTLSGPANSLDFVLSNFGNPTLAPLNITSVLNVSGTTTVNISDTLPQVGQFPLIKYGSKTGTGNFVIGTLPAGVSATISNNVGNTSIDLVITSTALIRWDGQVAGGVWDVNTTFNWKDYLTSAPAKFTTAAAVYFDDLALGTTTVNLGVAVIPGSITVTNDTLSYTIMGNGSINGSTGLAKQGTNSLTLSTTNGYTGATVISGGTLSITKLADGGSPSAIGSSSSSSANLVLDGGTLSYSGSAIATDRGYTLSRSSTLDAQSDMTFNGVVTPNTGANFSKTGNGTLFVKRAGANSLSIGGGGGAYDIVNGGVVMDGSSGAQVNTINGELWVGGTTSSTGGKLILTNTTLNVSSWLAIARGSGTGGYTSSFSLYNSSLRSGNGSMAYDNGIPNTLQTAVLTLNGTSTYTNTGDSNLGESSGGTAIINMNDSSVFFSNNRAFFGWHNNATGIVTIANSAKVIVNSWVSIGNEGGVGTVVVKDSGTFNVSSDLNVCDVNTGIGNLVAQNSAQINAGNIFVGKGAGSTGTFTISGNATVVSGNGLTLASGDAASLGTLNLNGGSLAVNLVQGNPGLGIFNFNGGKLIARNPFAANFMFNMAAINVLAGGAIIDSDFYTIAISEPLVGGPAGDGGLTKLGVGTLLLNNFNTYTNTTVVAAGALGGNGTFPGPVTVQAAGTLSPGAGGIGIFTVNNNLTIAGNVAVDVDRSATPSSDSVVVSGNLNNIGTGTVKVTNVGPALQAGDTFTLFNKPVVGGGALAISGAGAAWTNRLAIDGSIRVISTVPNFAPGGIARLPDRNMSLTAVGSIGSTYKLWASTNIALTPISTTWTLLNSGTVTVSPFTINDLTATNFSQRFYIFSTP